MVSTDGIVNEVSSGRSDEEVFKRLIKEGIRIVAKFEQLKALGYQREPTQNPCLRRKVRSLLV